MSLIDQARIELEAIMFGIEDSAAMIEILTKFFDRWDSGGAVSVAAPVLMRLIAGKPLSPLTGASSEWAIHEFNDDVFAQNIRCSTVFLSSDGVAYDTESGGRVPIIFPYWPKHARVHEPIFEVSSGPQSSEAGGDTGGDSPGA